MSKKSYEYIVGVDPGLLGGITILSNSKDEIEVHPMPTNTVIKGTKKKPKKSNEIDQQGVVDLLSKVKDKNVLFVIERVTARGGEAPNRAFNFGSGWGFLQGVAATLTFEIEIVSPMTWKKLFPELESKDVSLARDEIYELKEEKKDLAEELKGLQDNKKQAAKKDKKSYNPKIKAKKDEIKEKKKEIDKKNGILKRLAKTAARELATKKYPKHKDKFKLVKDDGKAEATLIALWGKNELVQKSK